MIYLTTGTNGAGKTLLTLWDVRQQQLRENRAVYFRGFTAKQQLLDWGWQEFKAEEWQSLPDGSICIFDEAQECFPVRGRGEPPQWIADIAKYRRKRGFDFWVITPHPSQIDIFVRRLIEKPSFHRHLKRAYGAQLVSELKYGFVELQCEKPGSGKDAEITMVAYRKEVFEWYSSASLHTVKRRLPRAFWVFFATIPVGLTVLYFAITSVAQLGDKSKASILAAGGVKEAAPGAAAAGAPGRAPGQLNAPARPEPMSAQELANSYVPRFAGLVHTAPRYDELTKPSTVPYPAACLLGRRPGTKVETCECFSQQGTRLVGTPLEICKQFVQDGFFVDWSQNASGGPGQVVTGPAGRSVAPAAAAGPAVIIGADNRPWLAAPGIDSTAPVFSDGHIAPGAAKVVSASPVDHSKSLSIIQRQ